MTLSGKTKPEGLCEHLKQVIRAIMDNEIGMSHDYQGTDLYCPYCDTNVSLEAYGEKFKPEDVGD